MSQSLNTVKAPVQQTQQHLQSWTRSHTEEKHKQNHHGFTTAPTTFAGIPPTAAMPGLGCSLSIGEEQIFKAWKLYKLTLTIH